MRDSRVVPFQLRRGSSETTVKWKWFKKEPVTIITWSDVSMHMTMDEAKKRIEADIAFIDTYGIVPDPGTIILEYDAEDRVVEKLKGSVPIA